MKNNFERTKSAMRPKREKRDNNIGNDYWNYNGFN